MSWQRFVDKLVDEDHQVIHIGQQSYGRAALNERRMLPHAVDELIVPNR